jgi:hypothetical protein
MRLVGGSGRDLDGGLERRNMEAPSREEVSSMCYERYQRRRREEDEESHAIWQEFERTTPISDPEPREVTEPERPEPERAKAVSER